VALEHLFQGSALNAVDAKGRVSIPAFLRSVIERRGDARTIVLAKHEAFPCLSAYDPPYAALKHAKLERLLEKEETSPDAQLEYQQRNLMAFAATEEVTYDSSGRILFPPDPRIPDDLKDIARFRLEERA
jgi:MraZ protein